jgi:signal transduction histidine kinase/DNA-binding response OmpR family regulator
MNTLPAVLIVDDREENLVAFAATLESTDRRLLLARSARAALELLLTEEVALAIVDIQMPEIDGFELAELMRGNTRTQSIPIIFVTAGHHDQRRVFAGYESGAVDFLTKPIEPRALRGKTEVFLELFRQRKQLAARVTELEAVLAAVPAAVFMVRDAASGKVLSNEFARQLLGLPDEGGTMGRDSPPYRLLHGEPGALGDGQPLQSIAQSDCARRDCEMTVEGPDGREVVLYGNTAPLHGPSGRLRGSVGAFVDITRLKQAEALLLEADRHKDEFLASLSHELRNPLMPITTSVEVLKRVPNGSDGARRALDVIDRQSRHLARLVEDLLDVTRIRNGKVRLRRTPVDLVAVLLDAAEDQRATFAAAGVELSVQMPDAPVVVDVDAARMLQVTGNMLGNAAKFTPRGGHARLSLSVVDSRARVSVADDGAGIPPEALGQLFRPFAQADRTLDRSRGGLGLGLAVVKQLVEMQGGTVSATSDGIGEGAEFVVELPLASRAPVCATAAVERDDANCGVRRVLLVEDNADGAAMFAELVRMDGHDVEVAPDGATALAVARRFQPHVVFCDIGLPGMDGYEVAKALRRELQDSGCRLVAVTGYATPRDRERAYAAGFDEHLAKPPAPPLVRAAIDRAVGSRLMAWSDPSRTC